MVPFLEQTRKHFKGENSDKDGAAKVIIREDMSNH